MERRYLNRRRVLSSLGIGTMALLAGCNGSIGSSDPDSNNSTTSTNTPSQGASSEPPLSQHIPVLGKEDVASPHVSYNATVPATLAQYQRFDYLIDLFVGVSAVDITTADWAVTGLNRTFFLVSVDFEAEQLRSELRSRGYSSAGTEGRFDLYKDSSGLVAVADGRIIGLSSDNTISLSDAEVVSLLIAFDSGEQNPLPDQVPEARTLLSHIQAEHHLYFDHRFEGTYEGDSDYMTGAEAIAAGGSIVNGGDSYRRDIAALFPEGNVRDKAFKSWLDETLPADSGASELSVTRDGRVLVGRRTYSLSQPTATPGSTPTSSADLRVTVTGSQFKWRFSYPNSSVSGRKELVLPVDTAIRLAGTSTDVFHAFSVPQLGLKLEASPEDSNFAVIHPKQTDEYTGYCTEYCGEGHSQMTAPVKVVSKAEFGQWLQ